MWSAAEQRLPVSFVILNNRHYAALDHFAQVFGMNRLPGTEIGGIDFVGLAKGMGVAARRVATVGEIDDALAWSLALPKPTLVEVIID